MVWSEGALFDAEGTTEAVLGGLRVPAPGVDRSQAAERNADFVVLGAELALDDGEWVLEEFRGIVVPAGGVEDGG